MPTNNDTLRARLRETVDGLARSDRFLEFGRLVDEAITANPSLASAAQDSILQLGKMYLLSEAAESFHERVAARWEEPMITGIASAPALLLAGAHLQAQAALSVQGVIISTSTISKSVEKLTQSVNAVLTAHPSFLDELLLELDARAVADPLFAASLRRSAAQLESYGPALQEVAASISKSVPALSTVSQDLAPRVADHSKPPREWLKWIWGILTGLWLILLICVIVRETQ